MKLLKHGGKRVAVAAAALACLSSLTMATPASAATLTGLTLTPTDPTQAATGVTYNLALASASGAAKCIRVHFGTSVSFAGLPAGMAFSSPTLTANATTYGSPTSSGDYVQATDATGVTPTSIAITGVTNKTTAASVYFNVELFSDTGCTALVDSGVGAFAVTENTVVSVTVDPSFTFTVANKNSACNGEGNFVSGAGSANAVALGHIAVSSAASGAQTLTVAGNAGGGYAVYMRGTQASTNLRSSGAGAHNWTDVAGTYASPAALGAGERFGYTYHDNVATGTIAAGPSSANYVALDNTNRLILDSNNTASAGDGCVGYTAQTGTATPAGSYTATVIYTAVPVF